MFKKLKEGKRKNFTFQRRKIKIILRITFSLPHLFLCFLLIIKPLFGKEKEQGLLHVESHGAIWGEWDVVG